MSEDQNWFGEDTATFGDRLIGAREALGIGQEELAHRLGVKIATVQAWENDSNEPRANKLQMLSGLLGVSLTWLINGTGDGLQTPPDSTEAPRPELSALLDEMTQLRISIDRATNKLLVLERQLRAALSAPVLPDDVYDDSYEGTS
ncbi:helix-turn-helix domain-containing protein [Tropicimonas sp. IMCC34011]|uniref:helix-turn-helix domain-containing protein n=1 Tax=Tropicimonas sp. IMCC34011 TaxID=2248759 RepID=UPI000E23E5C3|nr:helix-turn-helix domain-containing protein [Tropicimonas sp. IMCC34011]